MPTPVRYSHVGKPSSQEFPASPGTVVPVGGREQTSATRLGETSSAPRQCRNVRQLESVRSHSFDASLREQGAACATAALGDSAPAYRTAWRGVRRASTGASSSRRSAKRGLRTGSSFPVRWQWLRARRVHPGLGGERVGYASGVSARGCARVGCSGWQYRDWRGVVYPAELPQRSWLGHYATLFDTVEVNNTFYRLPSESAVNGWAARCRPVSCSRSSWAPSAPIA